jgi:aspartate dehydrogenase
MVTMMKAYGAATIGIIGFGAIGRDLAARLAGCGHRVLVLLRPGSPTRGSVPPALALVDDIYDLIDREPDLVIEAAGQDALANHGPPLLTAGVTVIAASSGALADPDLYEDLEAAARAGDSRLIVPAGALGGLDYLAALRSADGSAVRYTSRKPVAAWRVELAAAGHNPERLTGEVILFEGEPAEAARLHPRNLNAGLTVALAAAPTPVTVRVVADPAVALNTHEIEAEGPLGTASMRFANAPSADNPKTSALTAASLAAAVDRLLAPIIL